MAYSLNFRFRRGVLAFVGLAALYTVILIQSKAAAAADSFTPQYPDNPVSLYLPVPPGDQADLLFSLAQPFFRAATMTPITHKYIPGKGGGYAWRTLINAPSNGAFVAVLQLPSFLMQPRLPDPMYSATDITPLILIAAAPVALWVPENSPITSLQMLIDKAREQPGTLVIAGTGTGTGHQLAHVILNRAAGVAMLYIPYTGSTACRDATKQTAVACWGYAFDPKTMPGMRALAVADIARSKALPNVPTFTELNTPLTVEEFMGLCMAKTVQESVRKNAAEFFMRVALDPLFRSALQSAGFRVDPIGYEDIGNTLQRLDRDVGTLMSQYSFTE